MTTKHTPGPWKVNYMTVYAASNDCTVARIDPPNKFFRGAERREEMEYCQGNARLIAAAPELLVALDDLLTDMMIAQGNMRDAAKHDHRWEGCAEAIQPRVDAARAAIAKATGSAS
jgi:hypothetical protein